MSKKQWEKIINFFLCLVIFFLPWQTRLILREGELNNGFWEYGTYSLYFLDFLIKAINRLPSKGWWGIYNNGKLYCPESGPVGLGQLIMKITGGISERNLVLTLMGIEAFFGIIAILIFLMK